MNQPSDYAEFLQNFCAAVLSSESKVAVYSNNYQGAHIRALQNIYLTVQHYLKPKLFSALALVYVQHYPPTQWDFNIYGKDFPELLAAQTRSSKAQEVDWQLLAMIARIEHAISRAYYGYISNSEQLPLYTRAVSNTKFISQLQKQHPYTKIANNLNINRSINIRYTRSKIYVGNGLPEVSTEISK